MADQDPLYVPERLMQAAMAAAITKSVSEKLGGLTREFGELTKGMNTSDTTVVRLMLLEMVRNACGEFYTKMKVRIERERQTYDEQMKAQEGL